MSLRLALIPALLPLLTVSSMAADQGTVTLANAGTLACTAVKPAELEVADAELSCRFHAFFGEDANFTGHITRRGPATLPPGTRVLVWSVLAPSAEINGDAIAGTYSGVTGGTEGSMAGGKERGVVLQPISFTSQVGESPALTVLELNLEPMRA
jgi:hypothetical protein